MAYKLKAIFSKYKSPYYSHTYKTKLGVENRKLKEEKKVEKNYDKYPKKVLHEVYGKKKPKFEVVKK